MEEEAPPEPRLRHDRDVGHRGDRLGRLLQAAASSRSSSSASASRRASSATAARSSGGSSRRSSIASIEPLLETSARELLVEEGRVVGRARRARGGRGARRSARARGSSSRRGGFEWNKELAAQFLGGPLTHPNSPPCNEGDGLRWPWPSAPISRNMNEAWWCPSVVIPGEEYDGRPLHRGDFATRSMPHSIIVNRARRALRQRGAELQRPDEAVLRLRPARLRAAEPAGVAHPRSAVPRRVRAAHVHAGAAGARVAPARRHARRARRARSASMPQGLDATVARFNGFAVEGRRSATSTAARASTTTSTATPITRRTRTSARSRSRRSTRSRSTPAPSARRGARGSTPTRRCSASTATPIPGLYAAGNVMAGVTGPGYPGAGATIGAGMTFGYLAGTPRRAPARKLIGGRPCPRSSTRRR